MGEGVLARGDTGTCVEDFLLGERTARNFGISPCNVPKRKKKTSNVSPSVKAKSVEAFGFLYFFFYPPGRPRLCAEGELGDEAGLLLTEDDD